MRFGADAIVVNKRGEVLLMRRRDTFTWATPGGGVAIGELPPDTSSRETFEETGVESVAARLTGLYHWPEWPGGFISFTFRNIPSGGSPGPSREAFSSRFFNPDLLPRPMLSIHHEKVHDAVNHRGPFPVLRRQTTSFLYRTVALTALRMLYWTVDALFFFFKSRPFLKVADWHVGAFVVITDEQSRVLWVRRNDLDLWNLPGGGADDGEAPWETAQRECLEETGLRIEIRSLTGVYQKPQDTNMSFCFTAEVAGGQLTTGPESIEFGWFAVGKEPGNTLSQHLEQARDAVENPDQTVFKMQSTASLGS